MPALAKENTKEGLEAFIRYWYAVGNYANETGDISELRSLSTPECQPCAYFQRASSDGYTNGRWLVGGRVHHQVSTLFGMSKMKSTRRPCK
ncbi:DUF6318 family protein [Paenarthrobacter sp. NPDC090522]|uniref:DUF6318 family protein n=1 Tax=Paenarthrobacter sp. NPDC090522 TaxID=3364383 RepID=UPI0037F12039